MIKRLLKFAKRHKITTLVVILALVSAGYLIYQEVPIKSGEVRYETAEVVKGDIETIVSTAGQVGDANQVDVVPEVSGEVTKVGVSEGDEVYAGQFLVQIDSRDLENDIYQAQLAVESAQINLEKLKEPADAADITAAENALAAAENSLDELELTQEHELEEAGEDLDNAKGNRQDLDKDNANYDSNYQTYTTQIKDAKRKIEEYELSHPIELEEAEASIIEKENSLATAKEGTDSKDIQLQEIAVKDKQSKLQDLINQRSDYYITAPKAGIVASLDIAVGEIISSGGSVSALATIISENKTAEVTINEIDVTEVSVGQKASLTFDAIEDLEITGTVVEVDLIGTAEQGVVYHNVIIDFDSQDERVKNGMTVNADIITQSKEGVLMVPAEAVDGDYVEILKKNSPKKLEVSTGITDDLQVEITEGLDEGDEVVTKTIEAEEEAEKDDAQKSLFSTPGAGRMK